MPELLPYVEATHPDYARLAAPTFTADEIEPGILQLSGRCPRCAVDIEVTLVDRIYRGAGDAHPPSDDDAGDQPDPEPIICNCSEDHPNRPPGRVGCGAYWKFVLLKEN